MSKQTEWIAPDKPPQELVARMTVKAIVGPTNDTVEIFAEEYSTLVAGELRLENTLVFTGGKTGPKRITNLAWVITTRPFMLVPLIKEAKRE